MIINNVIIVNHNEQFKGSVEFDNNKIINVYHKQLKGIDGKGMYLIPSFVDTHTHGAVKFDFNDLTDSAEPKYSKEYFNYLLHSGVGAVIATTVTCAKKDLEKICANLKKFAKKYDIVKG